MILGGGQPQRRWRKPVALLDVLRSAQGEVQDYQRIRIEIEGRLWLSERAVGAMVHVLAELMENAVTFSKPPTPVEVTAGRVGRGLAVEIEDRGMGMAPEQFDEANALMVNPPRMDAVSRADDARLGMYVVARLAAGLGVKVEFRPSSFGGTRVVVLVPEELVLDEGPASGSGPRPDRRCLDRALAALATRSARARTASASTGTYRSDCATCVASRTCDRAARRSPVAVRGAAPRPDPEPAPRLEPLPRRVRLASLTTELREPRRPGTSRPRTSADPPASATSADPSRPVPRSGRSSASPGSPGSSSRPTPHPIPPISPAPCRGPSRPARKTDDDAANHRHEQGPGLAARPAGRAGRRAPGAPSCSPTTGW